MTSRGVYSVTLYENDPDLFIRYAPDETIGQITQPLPGQRSFTFDNCYFPQYTKTIKRTYSDRLFARTLNVRLRTKSELNNWLSMLNSYYGWIALIDFDNYYKKVVLDPLYVQSTNENYQQGVNYLLSLNHYVDSDIDDIIYQARDFLTVDQTDITVDQTDITVDQITI